MTHRFTALFSALFLFVFLHVCALGAEPPQDSVKIADANVSGVVEQNTVWPASLSPIKVVGNLTVKKGVTLFIEPGTQVRMGAGVLFTVEGTLVAEGKKDAKIVFTADSDEPKPGHWRGIRFVKDATGSLGGCTVEYAGNYEQITIFCEGANVKLFDSVIARGAGNGIHVRNGAKVEISGCAFVECSGTPVAAEDVNALPALGENSYEKNGAQQIWLKGGTISTGQSLPAQAVPYQVAESITIEKDGKLSVAAGAVLKFAAGVQLIVAEKGALDAAGTKEQPVILTALTDDAAGGDTNGDGDKTKPAPDFWRNIVFKKGSAASLENCVIRYGGYYDRKMIWIQESSPRFAGCEISDCSGSGIAVAAGAGPTIEGCTLTRNGCPVRLDDINCTPLFKSNAISGNASDSIWIETGNGLTGALTLADPGVPYHLSSNLTIQKEAALTVEAGVVLKNPQGAIIAVTGALTVKGTEKKPVYITAVTDDAVGGDSNADGDKTKPAAGFWRYIRFDKGSQAAIEHCVIRCGGYYDKTSIVCSDASPVFRNCTLGSVGAVGIDCRGECKPVLEAVRIEKGGHPVVVNGIQAMPSIRDCDFSGMAERVVRITGREITGEVTLPAIAYPYCFDESQLLKRGGKLTIEAGAVVKFRDRQTFTVEGELVAEGAEGAPIVFTSILDDGYLGDSNNDRGILRPNRGQWNHIRFSEGAKGVLKYCKILHAGSDSPNTAVFCAGASPQMENCEIAFVTGPAVRLEANSAPALTACKIHHSGMPLYIADPNVFPSLKDCTFEKNWHDAVFVAEGKITKSLNWSQTLVPYLLDGNLTVDIGAKLALAPGAVVKIRRDRGLNIQGAFEAVGTEENAITITSEFDDTAGGDTNHDGSATLPYRGAWRSINILKGATVSMEWCVVRYGGGANTAAISCLDAAPELKSTTIEDSQGFAATFTGKSAAKMADCIIRRNGGTLYFGNLDLLPSVTGCKFEENAGNCLRMPAGKITEKMTWTKQPIPYAPDGPLTVDIGAALTLEPGVIYKFQPKCELTVLGTLTAKGAADDRIFFTSIADDEAGGDTNGDLDFSLPSPNSWRCIRFSKGSSGTLENCVVTYGGSDRTAAVVCESASPAISACEIGGCDTAIALLGEAKPQIGPACRFGRCLGIALWNDTANDIDAAGNDWGTEDPEKIAAMIFDKADDANKGTVKMIVAKPEE